uniref:Uncharacterized protein n=1 Tax=Anguilla anguilla TaxID=7936 RepID=A0A0E9QRQ0_ANGAN
MFRFENWTFGCNTLANLRFPIEQTL